MEHSFFGNTCVSGWVYHYMKLKYNNPFIWHLVLDDKDYLKVCNNFKHYLNQHPTFTENDEKNGRYLSHPSISKTYPILRLDDVNFHFIHHKENEKILEKFNKRRDRAINSEIIPVAWDDEIKDKNVLEDFKNLENSILATGVTSQVEAAKQIIQKYEERYIHKDT